MTAQDPHTETSDLGAVLGFLTLRLWLAMRAFMTGIEKFAGQRSVEMPIIVDGEPNDYGLTSSATEKVYGLSHYHGVPESLYGKLQAEPFIPSFAMKLYDIALGPLLIILGLTLLLGVATRCSLFVMGLVYTSLSLGLVLLGQDAGIAWLGIHILLVAVALFTVRYNRYEVFSKF